MSVIKSDYLLPIYCENALPLAEEKNFFANGDDIVETIALPDLYVKKQGDEMFGDLIMNGTGVGVITNRIDSDSNGINFTLEFDDYLKLVNDETTSYKTLLINSVQGRTDTVISFSGDRLVDVGDPEGELQDLSVGQQDVVTKIYVDTEFTQVLQGNIAELEEEIDAIIPSVERGEWLNGDTEFPPQGEFTLLDSNGDIVTDYTQAVSINISTTDSSLSGTHRFDDVDDTVLEIFNSNSTTYAAYDVITSTDFSGALTPYYNLQIQFIQSFSHDDTIPATADGLARLKVRSKLSFDIPSGLVLFWSHPLPIPIGWFVLDGSSFDINANQALHDVLSQSSSYVSGTLPDFRDRYVGGIGINNVGLPGTMLEDLTKIPTTPITINPTNIKHSHTIDTKHKHRVNFAHTLSGSGAHKHSHTFVRNPDNDALNDNKGPLQNFSDWVHKKAAATDHDYYDVTTQTRTHKHNWSIKGATGIWLDWPISIQSSNMFHKHTITGGNTVTRPKTVIGYWIIKA